MSSLVLAACFFVGIHLFVSGTRLRDHITGAIGELPYMAAFSLASLLGLVWLCGAYANAETRHLWGWPAALRPLSTVVIGFAFLLSVVGITTRSPTGQGGAALLTSEEPATGILRITRHPFLAGVALWAGVHLLANGDTASLVLFAAMLLLATAGTLSIDRKRARKHGDAWRLFETRTSIIPFAAILGGRNELRVGELMGWRVVAAAGAFASVLHYHAYWFGVAPR